VKNNTAAQKKHCKSLAPDQKAYVLKTDAAEHKKHRKSLSPEQKGQIKSMNAVVHKKQYELLPPEKKSKTHGTTSWTFDRGGEENFHTDKVCCGYSLWKKWSG
jgi:hypothetical protein